MELIICPECNGKVSDKASTCPHCGCPIEDIVPKNIFYTVKFMGSNDKKKFINQSLVLEKYIKKDYSKLINDPPLVVATGLTEENAKYMMYDLERVGSIIEIRTSTTLPENTELNRKIDLLRKTKIIDGKLRCPKCNSDNVVVGTRGFSMLTGFIGSGKTVNRCGKCGYTWQPR